MDEQDGSSSTLSTACSLWFLFICANETVPGPPLNLGRLPVVMNGLIHLLCVLLMADARGEPRDYGHVMVGVSKYSRSYETEQYLVATTRRQWFPVPKADPSRETSLLPAAAGLPVRPSSPPSCPQTS